MNRKHTDLPCGLVVLDTESLGSSGTVDSVSTLAVLFSVYTTVDQTKPS